MSRRDEVLLAALDLLDEVGLDALTTRRLAARLGIQAGSLYRHFDSKRALLDAMAGHLLRGVAEDPPADDEPWEDAVRRVVSRMRAAMLSRRDGARLLTTFHGPPEIGERLVEGLVGRLVAAGRPREDAAVAVDTLLGYVNGFSIEEQEHDDLGPDARFPAGVELILAGIRGQLADSVPSTTPARPEPDDQDLGMHLRPMVHVEDMSASVTFYERLGATVLHGSRDGDWALLALGEARIGLLAHPPNPEQRGGLVELNFEATEPLDVLEARLRADGITITSPTSHASFGRQLQLTAPDGLLIKIDELAPDLYA
ncbi:TetR family transcriptional regulator [Actinomycetospora endophytica]|uniref:TetR family transcriptional regulator n=1 Tax=Actinomycetospora endophytica TaxID=2291215 RepID=A0ABS8P3C5_9PSEU|nr:TetR family transcriptional regulator [Actinomycetospora endophytica]MCD2192065.1 TetR family transcriptional regulator [Actinomycetospora endophytica]